MPRGSYGDQASKRCLLCGTGFTATQPSKRYCSAGCKQNADAIRGARRVLELMVQAMDEGRVALDPQTD